MQGKQVVELVWMIYIYINSSDVTFSLGTPLTRVAM